MPPHHSPDVETEARTGHTSGGVAPKSLLPRPEARSPGEPGLGFPSLCGLCPGWALTGSEPSLTLRSLLAVSFLLYSLSLIILLNYICILKVQIVEMKLKYLETI